MTLNLNVDQLQTMRSHAEHTYPNECCGLLLGKLSAPDSKELVQIRSMSNAWSENVAHDLNDDPTMSQTRRYWIDPAALLAVMKAGRTIGLDIIGIYHSHPDHPAIPSECDRRLAWQQYSYIILSVQQGIAQDIRSWQLDDTYQFHEEAIVLSALSNPLASTPHSPLPL